MNPPTRTCPRCGRAFPPDVLFCPADGAALRADRTGADLSGETIGERYHVLRKLGEGGMGQVYLAEHVRMRRKSAVKVMSPKLAHDAEAVTRFNREAENACRIQHPHVAAIYDFGETSDGLIYLAMEYVEGEPLSALVAREGALPLARAAALVAQAADGLAAAHRLGIVHRDLKPDNIMVARDPETGGDRAKVVDFGVAKAVGGGADARQELTRTGLSVGTPEYMSPEQLAGAALDGRSDIYSLGLVAFNVLTGTLPFPEVTSRESLVMRLTAPPASLAAARPDIVWPPGLQAVLDRALAPDPQDRWATATEFGRAFAAQVAEAQRASAATTAVVTPVEPVRPLAASSPPPPPAPAAATVVVAASAPSVPTRPIAIEAAAAAAAPAASEPAPRQPVGAHGRGPRGRALLLTLVGAGAVVAAVALASAGGRRSSDDGDRAAPAGPPAVATAPTVARKSDNRPRTSTASKQPSSSSSSSARQAAGRAGGTAATGAPRPSAPNDSAALAAEGAAVAAAIRAAMQRSEAGEYAGARAQLLAAQTRVARLMERLPASREVAAADQTVRRLLKKVAADCRKARMQARKARATQPACQ